MSHNKDHTTKTRTKVTVLEFYSNKIAIRRNHFNPLFYGGKLFQQYLVYTYARYEANRMTYIRNNQKTLRVELYKGLLDHISNISRDDNARIGNIFILPSSFVLVAHILFRNYIKIIWRWFESFGVLIYSLLLRVILNGKR
jgi:hypothetical protein